MKNVHNRSGGVWGIAALLVCAAFVLVSMIGCAGAQPKVTTAPGRAEAESARPGIMYSKVSPPVAMAPPPSTGAMAYAPAAAAADSSMASSEEYTSYEENPFTPSSQEKLSTFGVDVDTASYSNVRRFLEGGRLPPRDAVRIEELVNYFEYDWEEPEGPVPIALSSEAADCPWAHGHSLLGIGLRTRSISAANLPPANLVFLIDTSGSMEAPNKLPLVRRGFALLAETMRPQDRVSIVAYAGSAGLVLPPTSGANIDAILAKLEELEAGGSTAGGAGIALAYKTALENFRPGGNNRVILATDGDFNVGASSEAELVRLVESYRDKGVFLSIIGVGEGNLKDSRMESIADKGNGNYNYIDSVAEARKVLIEQMGATLLTVAKDVKIQVEFDPAVVASWRLIGYENRILAARDFADDRKDAGDMGAGHRVTALYEIELTAGAETAPLLGTLRVRYKLPKEEQSSLIEEPIPSGGGPIADASADLRFAAAVAAYGMLLRDSPHKGAADWTLVTELAGGALGDDPSGRRGEFLRLAKKASSLRK